MNRLSFVVGAASRRWILSALAVVGLCAACANPIQAQQQQIKVPTVEDLIGQAVPVGSPQDYPDVDKAIRRFFLDKEVDTARSLLEKAVRDNPKLPPAEIMMAQFLASAQQGPAARAELEMGVKKALKDSKGDYADPEYYLIFGDIAFQERRFTDADLLFAKGEEMVKKYPISNAKRKGNMQRRAFAGEAAVAEAREDWEGARARLLAWLQVDKDSAPAHQRMGRTLFNMPSKIEPNNIAMAEAEFIEAVKADKSMLPADVMMGRLYEESGSHPAARTKMEKAIAGLPKTVPSEKKEKEAYINTCLAVAQWAVGAASKGEDPNALKDAKEYADKAYRADNTSLDTLIVCGIIARLNNDLTSAKGYFEAAHGVSPSNFVAVNNLALVLAEMGAKNAKETKTKPENNTDIKKALELAEINARQYQQNAEAIATYGWALYRMGKLDDAKRAIFAVAQSGQVTQDAAFYVATVMWDSGDKTQARNILEQALNNKQPFAMRAQANALKNEMDLKEGKAPEKKGS